MSNLETELGKFESVAWTIAIFPIINIPTGSLKALVGVIQLVAGTALALIGASFACSKKGRRIAKLGIKHCLHGFGNLISGSFLSLPLIGNIIAARRNCYAEGTGGPFWYYKPEVGNSADIANANGFIYNRSIKLL